MCETQSMSHPEANSSLAVNLGNQTRYALPKYNSEAGTG